MSVRNLHYRMNRYGLPVTHRARQTPKRDREEKGAIRFAKSQVSAIIFPALDSNLMQGPVFAVMETPLRDFQRFRLD